MGDEAQRYIREARARALGRLAGVSGGDPTCPCPTSSGGGGEITRPPPPPLTASPPRPREPHVQQLLHMSPDKGPDPQTLAHLSQVHQLSQRPVPQPSSTPPSSQCPPIWDYQYEDVGQGGYEDPTVWQAVQGFDPYGPGAAAVPEPEGSASYYDILSEMREPEIDLSGGLEDILGRAHHRAMLAAGYRRDVPLHATPYHPGVSAMECPIDLKGPPSSSSLDEILAGAPKLPPSPYGLHVYQELDLSKSDEDYEDFDLLPPETLESVGDDFAVQTAEGITPMTDAFGLPFRRYPHAERAQQESLRLQQAERLRRQQEAARAQAEAQQWTLLEAGSQPEAQRLDLVEAERYAERLVPARTAAPPGARSGRTCPSRPTSGRAAAPTRTPGTSRAPTSYKTPASSRTPSVTPRSTRSSSKTPQPSTSRGGFPASTKKTLGQLADEEKAAKTAAALAATKKRTQYQPPKLKSRPPSKPPTKPQAPRGLDKRGDKKDRGDLDPTRAAYYSDDYCPVEPEPIWDVPQPITYPSIGGPVEVEPEPIWDVPQPITYPSIDGPEEVPPELLEEVTGIICQTRDHLVNTINKYK